MNPLEFTVQQIINAVSLGSLYAMVAVGLSMVFGILRMTNFAHGDMMMTGSYASSYKFLFIFVILFTSIECERVISLIVSILSALIILAIDLFCAPWAEVNTHFEDDIVLAFVFLIIALLLDNRLANNGTQQTTLVGDTLMHT